MALTVSPEAFRAQMEWLRSERYRVVPLADVLESRQDDCRTVAITFDDGYSNQLMAAEILEHFGFSATFFVVPDFLDGRVVGSRYWERWEHFGWNETLDLARRGFEIGAHSASHAVLTRCQQERIEAEVGGAKRRLETFLQRPIDSFSYPHGAFSPAVERAVEGAGYRLACTSIYGSNVSVRSRFALRRLEITGVDWLSDFRLKLYGKYDWLGAWQRRQAAHA